MVEPLMFVATMIMKTPYGLQESINCYYPKANEIYEPSVEGARLADYAIQGGCESFKFQQCFRDKEPILITQYNKPN